MDTTNKKLFCISQFLYTNFIEDFKTELQELCQDSTFVFAYNNLKNSVNENIEFCENTNSPDFIQFKRKISENFYELNLHSKCPSYGKIYNAIRQNGQAGASAAITVYYAFRLRDLSKTNSFETPKLPKEAFCRLSQMDYREKWEANWRCDDGHKVRSKNEQLVDNWLYNNQICHAYEKKIFDKTSKQEYISDFYIPSKKLFIEIWGMTTPEYQNHKQAKIKTYENNGYKLFSLEEKDIQLLDDTLTRILL